MSAEQKQVRYGVELPLDGNVVPLRLVTVYEIEHLGKIVEMLCNLDIDGPREIRIVKEEYV